MKVSTLSLAASLLCPGALAAWKAAEGKSIVFSPVTGIFLQDDNATDPSNFDFASVNFGLINRTYSTDRSFDVDGTATQWERFAQYVNFLNHGCRRDDKVRYKVLIMGRHGEGWHNAAESFYGTPAWNCYWAEREGNGTATWSDPRLTPAGAAQAFKANAYFKDLFANSGLPYFDSYYSSPLTRCLNTSNIIFGDIDLPADKPFDPIIKEGLREGITLQTCNRRSTKSQIASLFPNFTFEDGFTENDEIWHSYDSETGDAELARANGAVDDIFREDEGSWISITSHSGLITKLLVALNHRAFRLDTGQMIPVLVKAQIVDQAPTKVVEAYEPYSTCDAPPITSIAGQGCVCPTATAAPFKF